MKIEEATAFIAPAVNTKEPQVWADLGCGDGLFSSALDRLLPAGSTIHAIDKEVQSLSKHQAKNEIIFHQLDFGIQPLPFTDLDGIIMANSLHFFEDKVSVFTALKKHVRPGGNLIVIEYDLINGNPWVPHPITFKALRQLFQQLGYQNVRKIGERNSAYGPHKMYSCAAIL
jgi:trans-aconitate methyltransferase